MKHDDMLLELTPSMVTLSWGAGSRDCRKSSYSYIKFPVLRSKARLLVRKAAELCRDGLFSGHCTFCGRCCQEKDIAISAREIQAVAAFLEIDSLDEARRLFIVPSFTWNKKDGTLKKARGACIFFRKDPAAYAGCSIYPVRPSSCRNPAPGCVPGNDMLIASIARLSLSGDTIRIHSFTGNSVCLPLEDPGIRKTAGEIRSYITAFESRKREDYDYITREISARIIELELDCARLCNGCSPAADARLLRELVQGLHDEGAMDPKELGKLHKRIMALLARESEAKNVNLGEENTILPAETHIPGRKPNPVIQKVIVKPFSLSFSMAPPGDGIPCSLFYRQHPAILRQVRRLILVLVCSDDESLLEALEPEDLACFKCGECCRCFRLEVTPLDIARMASHLAMTREAFREKFLHPSLFSWNEGNGIMAKQNRLPPEISYNYSACLFLRKKDEGIFYCSIYDARPASCRDFTPSDRICRTMRQRKRAGELVDSIASVEINGTELTIVTEGAGRQEPLSIRFDLKKEKHIGEAYNNLERELLRTARQPQAERDDSA